MTIITKPLFGEKKGDKLEVPLVENEVPQEPTAPSEDVESQSTNIVILRAKVHRVHAATTWCLFMTSLIVVTFGLCAGKYLYDQYISTQMRRFKGYAQIPMTFESNVPDQAMMDEINKSIKEQDDIDKLIANINKNNEQFPNMHDYFGENFEIGLDRENYEKIDVPDFKDGRNGRFIHDFNTNITGIIDLTGNRCFVMPLDRDTVLPPRSLFDLIHKMWEGYYKVDTQVVRQTMRVVTPPLDDLDGIGTYIAKECENRPVYKLEKYVGGVVKRSADLHVMARFAQFSGNKITEFDIVNLDEVKDFEQKNNIH